MKKILLFAISAIVVCSCGSVAELSRGDRYAQMYEEKPLTLLVMPPINNSTCVEAKELLYTSINRPLIEAGYYVLSPNIVNDVLKNETVYNSEFYMNGDLKQFHQKYGADAVVFSIIDTWTKIGFGIDTKIRYIIKSTKTNEVLFERSCDLYLNLQERTRRKASATTLLVDIATSAITTAITEHIVAARKCNYFIFEDLPFGKYSPYYDLDKEAPALPKDITATVR